MRLTRLFAAIAGLCLIAGPAAAQSFPKFTGFVVDDADAASVPDLRSAGLAAAATNTLMVDVPTTARIAAAALSLVDRAS